MVKIWLGAQDPPPKLRKRGGTNTARTGGTKLKLCNHVAFYRHAKRREEVVTLLNTSTTSMPDIKIIQRATSWRHYLHPNCQPRGIYFDTHGIPVVLRIFKRVKQHFYRWCYFMLHAIFREACSSIFRPIWALENHIWLNDLQFLNSGVARYNIRYAIWWSTSVDEKKKQ